MITILAISLSPYLLGAIICIAVVLIIAMGTTRNLPYNGPGGAGGTVSATDAVNADTVAMRTSNADLQARRFITGGTYPGFQNTGFTYIDQQDQSSNFTVNETTNNGTVYLVTTAASNRTATLEAASGLDDKVVIISKVDTGAGTVIVTPDGSETINGKATFTLYSAGDTVALVCDGTNWRILWASMRPVTLAKTASFTVDWQDFTEFVYICDTTSGSITATFPAAATMKKGATATFKKIVAANSLILDGDSSETIDGAATKTATDNYAAYKTYCSGAVHYALYSIGSWS